MSFPYIIWTLRRTGGTTLTAFINSMSEFSKLQHEPFNEDRVLGHIAGDWRQSGDVDAMTATIETALAERPVIKHCHELLPPELNRSLLETTTRMGYRHVLLDRRADVDRILSLELAKLTGVWGRVGSFKTYEQIENGKVELKPINIPDAVAHLRFCQARRRQFWDLLEQQGVPYCNLYFEDVYSNPEAGRFEVRRVLDFLAINPHEQPNYQNRLREALTRKGQNSARVMDLVPNIAEARTELNRVLQEIAPVWPAPGLVNNFAEGTVDQASQRRMS